MVNLSHWVNKEATVTYKNGQTDSYKVKRCPSNYLYYEVGNLPYTIDGIHLPNPDFDIIKIQPTMNKKAEQLKKQIKELQEQLDNIERSIPEGFGADKVYKFLYNCPDDGLDAIFWGKNTEEGEDYWLNVSLNRNKRTDDDTIQLQKWIIESYRKQLGK